MRRLLPFLGAAVFAAAAVASLGHDDDGDEILRRGRQLMAQGRFAEAATVLEGVAGPITSTPTVLEARLLRVKALLDAKNVAAASAAARSAFEELPVTHAARGRARSLLADAARAEGRHDEVARHYEDLCELALSDAEGARVAAHYFTLAADLAKGRKSDDPLRSDIAPDPKRAAELYQQGLTVLGKDAVPEVVLPLARALLSSGQAPRAVQVLTTLLRGGKWSTGIEAEARYRLAEAHLASNQPGRCREECLLVLALENVEETPFAALAHVAIGDAFSKQGTDAANALEAATAYTAYLQRYPAHDQVSAVRERRARGLLTAGLLDRALSALDELIEDARATPQARASGAFEKATALEGLERYDDARDALRRYLAAFPDDQRVPEAQSRLPQLLLSKARRQLADEQRTEAIATYAAFLNEYPLAAEAASIALEVGRILRAAGQPKEAITALSAAKERYRQHAPGPASEAGFTAGVVQEEDLKDLDAAIATFRSVVTEFGGQQGGRQAAQRILALETVELSLLSPRLFAPGENPTVTLTTRNVEKVTVRVYKVNAERLFEERGSLDGIADVEVALVKAAHSFEFAIPDYRRYRRDLPEIPVTLGETTPLSEGAYLVSVETDDRRAIVPIFVSALRLVVKESPLEVFVWATDAKSGLPVPEVRVLVRGDDVKASVTTGADGVARLVHDQIRGRCRVLGVLGAGVVPAREPEPAVSGRVGLVPRVAVTFDRPLYRPGTEVRFQAIARDVSQGSSATPKAGTEVLAAVIDPSQRVVARQTLVLGEFGTLHGGFALPTSSALGTYQLQLRTFGRTFSQAFEVLAYRKPEYRVQVTPKESVLAPGSSTAVALSVDYFFGGPVREAPFEWQLFRKPLARDVARYSSHAWYLQATGLSERKPSPAEGWTFVRNGASSTDRAGQAEFSIVTETLSDDHEYLIQVSVRDTTGEWVTGAGRLATGSVDRFAVVLPQRRAWRKGDTADIRVITRDLLHGPVDTKGRLQARLRRLANGRGTLDTVAEADVATGLTGEVTVRLTLPEAGTYSVMFEGEGRAGVPVVAEATIEVSGETPDLENEARLVLEDRVVKEGDVARMHLSVPRGERPVLLAFEAEKVIAYRLHTPRSKSEVLEIPVEAGLAPNVTVTVAAPHGDRLLTAEDTLVVLRYLDVSVAPERNTARPGEKVTLRVVTKDQLGRPLAASVAVKAVDRALEDLGGRADIDPRYVFHQDVRDHLVRTGSSFEFRWEGPTRLLDPDLVRLEREKLSELETGRFRDAAKAENLDGLSQGGGGGVAGRPGARQSLRRGRAGEEPNGAPQDGSGSPPASAAPGAPPTGYNRGVPELRKSAESGFRLESVLQAIPMVQPILRENFLEVAGFWPDVVTGADGEASVILELPDNLTTWTVTSIGTSKGTSVGRGSASVRARKDLMVRMDRPPFLTSKDTVRIPVVVDSTMDRSLAVQLEASSKDPSVLRLSGARSRSFALDAFGQMTVPFTFDANAGGVGRMSATVRSEAAADALEIELPILPFGVPFRFAEHQELVSEVSFDVAFAQRAVPGSESYQVLVRGDLADDLFDGLVFLGSYPYGCLEQSVHRWVPAMVLAKALEAAGRPVPGGVAALRANVAAGLAQLVTHQTPDGAFSYWPGAGTPHPWATALAADAIARCEELGFAPDSRLFQSSRDAALRAAGQADIETNARAALLLAAARGGASDPSLVAGLARKRSEMSTAALCRLFLAARRMGCESQVPGLVNQIEREPAQDVPAPRLGRSAWSESRLEGEALRLTALTVAGARETVTSELAARVRSLLNLRSATTPAVAAGVEALADFVARRGLVRVEGAIDVLVGGKSVAKGQLDASASTLTLTIPATAMPEGRHRVTVRRSGGTVPASCRLLLRHTEACDAVTPAGNLLTVERRVTSYRDPNGRDSVHEPGFDIVKPDSRPKAKPAPSRGQVVAGDKVTVELVVTARQEVRYVAIEDPQIAGLDVIESGIRGGADRHERRADSLVFFKDHLAAGERMVLTYPCYAVHEGRFRALAAAAEPMYEPEIFGRSADLSLEVVADPSSLARIAPAPLTPDELYARGVECFQKKDWRGVVEALAALPSTFDLRDEVHDDVTKRLLVARLQLDQWLDAVKLEDALRVRNPRLLAMDPALDQRMGRAFVATKEPEVAVTWFEKVVAFSLEREVAMAETYGRLGRPLDRVARLRDAVWRHPTRQVGAQHLRLSDLLLEIPDASIGTKAALLPATHRVLWQQALDEKLSLSAWYSGEALAEQAWLQRISYLVGLVLPKRVIAESDGYLSRFGHSQSADLVQADRAEALYALERYDDAAKAAKAVWDYRWPRQRTSGVTQRTSQRRDGVGYLLGKIAHVQGRYAEAVKWYGEVKGSIPDAAQSWLFFTETNLRVEPVVSTAPHASAKIPVQAKNVGDVQARAYPVDLLVLFAVKKSFDRLASADLSGIDAGKDVKVTTSLPDYTEGLVEVDLGTLEAGAYLVSLRGAERSAGTLLLVSDARLTIQRDGGAVRVYLTDGLGKPVAGAKVRLATAGRIFHSGTTDVRGMLSAADPGNGALSAVAVKDEVVAAGTHR